MKRHYTTIIVLLLSTCFRVNAQNGALQNGGFENWTNQLLYEDLMDWQTTNTQEFNGTSVVTKSATAQDGLYSVKLETLIAGGDTTVPYVFHGTAGSSGPDGGIAYSTTFTDVRLQCQTNLLGTDTLNAMIMKYLGGSMVSMEIIMVATGTNASWTQKTIAVTTGVQDSLFIGFMIGRPDIEAFPVSSGSWVLIDNVEMLDNGNVVTALPDNSFENWTDVTVENPDDWYTANNMLAASGLNNANKTIDASTGSFAIELSTIETQWGDTMPGFLSFGIIDFYNQGGSPFMAAPYTATPATVSGSYKYSAIGGDAAGVSVVFYQGGMVVGQHWENLTNQPVYTAFSSPLTISATPDSLELIVMSGNNPGSVLKLDDLQFSGGNVGYSEFVSNEKFNMYPNPANDFVTLNSESNSSFSYYIYNVIGKLVESKENVTNTIQLKIGDYPKGTYLVRIVSGSEMFTEKLIIE